MTANQIQNLLGTKTKYSKIYLDIIFKAKKLNRKKLKKDNISYIYYENHHILPRSIFIDHDKSKWNLILLTAKEHFICHLLIWKHYKSLKDINKEIKMSRAFSYMNSKTSKQNRFNSKLYTYYKLNLKCSKEQKDILSRKAKQRHSLKSELEKDIANKTLFNIQQERYNNMSKEDKLNAVIPLRKGLSKWRNSLTKEDILRYKNKMSETQKKRMANMSEEKRKVWLYNKSVNARDISGSLNPSAKKINIYNELDKLIHECFGNLRQICEENNIPYDSITDSYKNQGKRLYQTHQGVYHANKKGNIKYKGWYALYDEEIQSSKHNKYITELPEKKKYKRKTDINNTHHFNSVKVEIYTNLNELVYKGYKYKIFCENNNLPYRALCNSYKNQGKRIYDNVGNTLNKLIEQNYYQYKGWYAKKV